MANTNTLSKGIIWSVIEVVVKRVFDFLVKLVLARLLYPEEFGIVGLAVVVSSFVIVLSDVGINSALIQREDDKLNESHFNTSFWAGLLWALILYTVIYFFVTPIAADFYKEEKLLEIIPILSLPIIFSAFNSINRAILKRNLDFKRLAFVNNLSSITAGIVAIAMAFLGAGIWSLVANIIIPFIISVPLLIYIAKWLPKFDWNTKAFLEVFSFGIFTLGTSLVQNLSSNINYIILGKFENSDILGTYTFALLFTLSVKSQITAMLNRVMFPYYSSIQSNLLKIKTYYLKVIRYYALIVYPIMLILIIHADTIIIDFFGDKWELTILPLKILAIGVVIDIPVGGYNLIFRSIGKSKFEFQILLGLLFFVFIPSLLIGTYYYGYIGTAISSVVATLIKFLIVNVILVKSLQFNYLDVFMSIRKTLLCFLLLLFVYGLIDYLNIINPYLSLVLLLLSLAIIYRYSFKEDWNKIMSLLKRK